MKQRYKRVIVILISIIYFTIFSSALFYVHCVNWQNENGKAEIILTFTIKNNSPTFIILDEEYKLW